jgi:enoyl-CoA hydratase
MVSASVTVGSVTAYRQLSVDVDARGIATLTMERPDKLNAVGEVMHTELALVFRELERDPSVRVIVVTGRGKAFSAGGDIDFMQDMIDRPDLFERVIREAKEIVLSMLDCEKPVIAKVNGHAVGLGATIALFCDVVFMSTRAKIGDPHVGAGLVAADGGAIIWPQLIGFARAKQYLLTGDLLMAKDAERIGLVNQVCEPDALDSAVDQFAVRLASGAQKAIRWTKATTNIALKQIANAALDAGLAYEAVSNLSADHIEAVSAFREARAPVFA